MEKLQELLNTIQRAVDAKDPEIFLAARQAFIDSDPNSDLSKGFAQEQPHETLRKLAAQLDQGGHYAQAWPWIEMALTLAPGDVEVHKTHGLVAMSNLMVPVAIIDFSFAQASHDPSAAMLLAYIDLVFPFPRFAPIRFEGFHPPEPLATYEVKQSPEAIRQQIQVYATRLHLLREQLIGAGADPEAPWLIPSMEAFLPLGTLSLRENERIPAGLSRIGLQNASLGDWAALSLLLWLLGQKESGSDQVVSLDSLVPRAGEISRAVNCAEFALWSCRDRQMTGGEQFKEEGFSQSLEFRGIDLDQLPPAFAQNIAEEIAGIQAMLYWLTRAGADSPFTDGFRDC